MGLRDKHSCRPLEKQTCVKPPGLTLTRSTHTANLSIVCVRDPKIFVWQRCFAFLCAALRCFALLGSPPFTFFKIQDPYTPGWVVCTSSIYVPRGPSKHPCRLWAEAVQEHRGLQNPARREGKGAVPHCLLCLLFFAWFAWLAWL